MPSHCDAGCRPVWESFFTRCQALIRGDPNRLEFVEFHDNKRCELDLMRGRITSRVSVVSIVFTLLIR